MGDDDHEDYQKIIEMVKQLVRQALEKGQVQPGIHGIFIMIHGAPAPGNGGEHGPGQVTPIIDTLAEVHEAEDEVLVLTEMPGVPEDQLHLRIREGILWIVGISGMQGFRARVPIQGVEPEPVRCTCCHGVVEAVFRKIPAENPT
jgi:HSP20 family molecular chaperone IbpA